MRTLIRGGTLVTATRTFEADILIDGETIAQIDSGLSAEGAEVVDAAGKLVMPGGVDPHTHFDLPMFGTVSSDDHYSGHKAAAFGGTTTVLDFVSFDGPTMMASVEAWRRKAEKAAIDYGFHMNLTRLDCRRRGRDVTAAGGGHHHTQGVHCLQRPPATLGRGHLPGSANGKGTWHAGHGPLREWRRDRDPSSPKRWLRGTPHRSGMHARARLGAPLNRRFAWLRWPSRPGRRSTSST